MKNVIIGILVCLCIGLVIYINKISDELKIYKHKAEVILDEAEEAERRAIQLAAEAIQHQKMTELQVQKTSELEAQLKECLGK